MDAGPQPGRRTVAPRRALARAGGYLFHPHDLWALVAGGETDARIEKLKASHGVAGAFEAIYAEREDPWRTLNPRFSYQIRKYDTVMSLVPEGRHFGRALDLGCGLGTLARMLAGCCGSVLGVDVAWSAVDRARLRHADAGNLTFRQGDVLHLPDGLEGRYDLITIMDTLYYLPDASDAALDRVADRVAGLMAPGGLCVLSDHLFIGGWDRATRLSRRIHRAFVRSPRLSVLLSDWRPFFQTTLLTLSAPINKATT